MLEERLSSTYSQPTLGYGAVPGAPQYPNMTGLPSHVPGTKTGAENFYYGGGPDTARAPTGFAPHQMVINGYEAPPSGIASTAYPQSAPHGPPVGEHGAAWGHHPYPSLSSPVPGGQPAAGAAAPTQYYTSPPEVDPSTPQYSEPAYQATPVMHRESPFQPSAPSAPEPHSFENMHSATYTTVPPAGPVLHQQPSGQPSGQPPQSYYYQQQPQPSAVSGYPPTTSQPGAYPGPGHSHPPAPQPTRPVEESLIEL